MKVRIQGGIKGALENIQIINNVVSIIIFYLGTEREKLRTNEPFPNSTE